MKIMDLKYKPFSIKFNTPFINSTGTLNERKGFILSITDELGNSSLGEIAPLPGFSSESLDEAREDLSGLLHILSGMETGDDLQCIKDLSEDYILTSSARFGFEQAMLGLLIKRDRSISEKLFLKTKTQIDVNAVVGLGCDGNVISQIENKMLEGFSTFKIKAGRNNFTDDLNLIKGIRRRFGGAIKIRLDANGKWDFEKARCNIEMLEIFDIEYIEEPCGGIENLIALSEISSIPVAIDESLVSMQFAFDVMEQSSIPFIIIKPMIRGALIENIELIRQAAILDRNIIISSSFETALGISQLAFLSSLTHHSYAHGLDTIDYFSEYFFADKNRAKKGIIDFSPLSYPKDFNYDAVC